MSFGGDSHLFSGAAKLYANPSVRPLYPPGLFDQIYRFCGPSRDAALDVATGSGQCSRELAKDFRKVNIGYRNILAYAWGGDGSKEVPMMASNMPG